MGVIKTFKDGDSEAARWDIEDSEQVKLAAEVFAGLALNHSLIDVSNPQVIKPRMETFDPLVKEIFAVPQLSMG
jgi:hypothetical protein